MQQLLQSLTVFLKPLAFLAFFVFHINLVSGQVSYCHGPNGQGVTAYFNAAVVMSDDYLIDFQGNKVAGKAWAETNINAGVDALHMLFDLFGFDMRINVFFYSDSITTQPYIDDNQYVIAVRQEFHSRYPCVKQDGIIVLRRGSGDGFGSTGAGGVKMGSGFMTAPYRVAHELGHLIGLTHCCTDTPQQPCDCNTLMCPSYQSLSFSTGCEYNDMNNLVLNSTNCPKLLDYQDHLPDNYKCQNIILPTVSIATDQPYLLEASRGCIPDRSVSMFTVTVSNNTSSTITGATLKMFYQPVAYDFNPMTMGMDFNHDEVVNSNFNALSTWENGSIKPFNLAANMDTTFHFQILYNPVSPPVFGGSFTNQTPIAAHLYLGTSGEVVKTAYPIAITTLNAGTYTQSLIGDPTQPIFVNGEVSLDPSGPFSNNQMSLSAPFYLVASGGAIKVGPAKTVNIGQEMPTIIEGCSTMWKGFSLFNGGKLNINNATIMDAQKAIAINSGDNVTVKNSRFYNNNYGIFTQYDGYNHNWFLTLTGNEFGTIGTLKPAYTGQSPLPIDAARIGFVGIYAKEVNKAPGLNIMEDTTTGRPNRFFNLKYGIISDNSNVTVTNTSFTGMVSTFKGANYDQGPKETGRAIYAKSGSLTVDGKDFLASKVIFNQCPYGVETENSLLTVRFTQMNGMSNGISVLSAINRSNNISDNAIQAERFGIKVNNVTGLPALVVHNIITNLGTQQPYPLKTVGIEVSNTNLVFQSLEVTRNNVSLTDGGIGISLKNNINLWAFDNDVNMSNLPATKNYGLRVEGGNTNLLSCNRTDGFGNTDSTSGVYSIHADRSSFVCNHTQNTGYGLRFEGMMIGEADGNIITNTMKSNGIGLYYGEGAITGPQKHRGNIWDGTGARHASGFNVAIQSPYTVDGVINPLLLPNPILPAGWFTSLPNPNSTPTCPVNNTCFVIPPSLQADTDRKIARGELQAGDYTVPANWLAQRRLYARLTTEGNPYGSSDNDFRNFILAAGQSGLVDYADVQISIRHLFDIRQMDVDSLKAWETRMQTITNRIIQLDGLLSQSSLSSQDRTQYASERSAKTTTLANLDATRTSKLDALRNGRLSAVPAIVSKNNALTGSAYYQQYEKVVNDIFLQTIASDVYTFTTTQQTLLDSIARQCPLSRGEAVLRARALLSVVQGTPIIYDNETACLPANREGSQQTTSTNLRIYPNPTSDVLTIDYPDWQPAEFFFFNTLGQHVLQIQLEGAQVRQVDVANLQPGIYWYVLHTAGASSVTGKILIAN